ncbi:phage minor capsid protein [Marinilactibacillus sp. Marseille-P9653]|uniref:phage minor capsid protein n=1 Tax=Marinilactibacillus sp. Marseille-P9653 TaxID=2866583 RepID=UPI001CE4B16C|nr:phage minor capsid protein [Marinilactibacillus sp. Marseille-P9653]
MIAERYFNIEWTIIQLIVNYLEPIKGETVVTWKADRLNQVDQLTENVIDLLAINKNAIQRSVKTQAERAYELVRLHLLEEFGIEVEYDPSIAQEAVEYLNRDITRALPSTSEELYLQVIEQVAGEPKKDEQELFEVFGSITLASLEKGLTSGFIQSDGVVWSLKRVAAQIEKKIYINTYNRFFEKLRFNGVELVKVHKFVKPRPACAHLQASGTICIVPRTDASPENLVYPNIWDEEHRYEQPGGHRGSDGNCRHVWHGLNASKDKTNRLYNPIDEIYLALEGYRIKFINNLNTLLGH